MSDEPGVVKRLASLRSPILPSGLSKRAIAVSVLKAFETGNEAALMEHVHVDVVQHNLGIPSGRTAWIDFARAAKNSDIKITILRVLEDSENVVIHNLVDFDGTILIAIDVYRFDSGFIVEHWDNVQSLSGDMKRELKVQLAAASALTDLECTQDNHDFVLQRLNSPELIKDADLGHIPPIHAYGDWSALTQILTRSERAKNFSCYKIVGDGNFVFAMMSVAINFEDIACFAILRVDANSLVECWSVESAIPERSLWLNENTKF